MTGYRCMCDRIMAVLRRQGRMRAWYHLEAIQRMPPEGMNGRGTSPEWPWLPSSRAPADRCFSHRINASAVPQHNHSAAVLPCFQREESFQSAGLPEFPQAVSPPGPPSRSQVYACGQPEACTLKVDQPLLRHLPSLRVCCRGGAAACGPPAHLGIPSPVAAGCCCHPGGWQSLIACIYTIPGYL